eukprot:CAMPEP_0118947650 /NCGR_PEP_ID=MMETSP1169-20130426/46404_1 /TAXON_ID=36882 /ORGANISM="Pyramimonas obovata, Strain CCMP722" /LENGTH=44 /DNA_ID= /DNA_START= /DNA_END= /DNA_ORIENTATION=
MQTLCASSNLAIGEPVQLARATIRGSGTSFRKVVDRQLTPPAIR